MADDGAEQYARLADIAAPTDLRLPELLRNIQAGLADGKLQTGDMFGVRFNVRLVIHYNAFRQRAAERGRRKN